MSQNNFETRLQQHKLRKHKVKRILEILQPHGGLKQYVIRQRMQEKEWKLKPYLITLEELNYIGYDPKIKVYYITQEGQTLLKRLQQ